MAKSRQPVSPASGKGAAQRAPAPKAAAAKVTATKSVAPKAAAISGTVVEQIAAEPPGTVRLAVKLMYAGAVLSVLDLIATLSTIGKAKSDLQSAHPQWTASHISATVHVEIAYFVFTWILTIAFWLVMARTNLAGRGWARIASTALCTLSTLSFAEYIAQPSSLVSKLILIPLWAVGVTAIVCLWRPQTSAYIRAGKD